MSESNSIYIVYQTTNLVNQKIYVGVHKQEFHFPVLFDDYFGSGVRLISAVNKYGRENFVRETLFVYYDPQDAFDKEAEIVDEEFVKRKDTYNIALGGTGGWRFSDDVGRGKPGFATVRDKDNNIFKVHITDPRYTSGELVSHTKGVPKPAICSQQTIDRNNIYWSDPNNRQKASETQREIMKNREKIKCEFCGAITDTLNHKRWHGENCKQSPNFDKSVENARKGPQIKCEYCGKEFNPGNYAQHHGEKCRFKNNLSAMMN